MILEFQRRDLKPEHRLLETRKVEFEHFRESAQQFGRIAGKAIFHSEGINKPIQVPKEGSFHVQSAFLTEREGRKMILTWKNGVQLVLLTAKTSKEVGRLLTRLRESPYSFERIALLQAYDYPASISQGKPVLHSGPLETVGIYVPYPDLISLPARQIEHLMKL